MVKLNVQDEFITCFLDSGSSISLIKQSLAYRLIDKFKLTVHSSNKVLKNVSNDVIDINGQINLTFKTKFYSLEHCLLICPNFSCFKGGILLGRDFLNRCNANINFQKNQLQLFGSNYNFSKTKTSPPHITCISENKLNISNDPNITLARTKENINIQQSSALYFKLAVSKSFEGRTVLISASHLNPSLILPRCIAVVENNEIPITLFNLTDKRY